MRQQNWTVGGRYMLPDLRIRKSLVEEQLTEEKFVALLQEGGKIKLTSDVVLTKPV